MSYDIAIGRCVAIEPDHVVVRIEGAMLVKLDESYRFHGPSKSLLKVLVAICSKVRPPKVESELYVDSDALLRNPDGFLDMRGDGSCVPVDLRLLLAGPTPGLHPASHKGTAMNFRLR